MNQTLLLIVIALAALNLFAFIMVGRDKSKSVHGEMRTPEVYFFVWAVFFCSLGVLLGMFTFHNKTRKLYFVLGLGALLIQQAALIILITNLWMSKI